MKYPPAPQSRSLQEMEVANYCEGLDPSYSTLGFENAEVLYGGGKMQSEYPPFGLKKYNWQHLLQAMLRTKV